VEYLSTRLGFPYNPDNNLAQSGAQTDDTFGQVRDFIPTTDVHGSLFVVWAGGNDFLQEYDKNWFSDANWDRQVAYSVGNLSNAVVTLYSKGARFILVPNTVDVTDIPLLNWLPGFIADYLRDKVEQFNRELAEALAAIHSDYPALTLFQFDFYRGVKSFLANASAYGFTETDIDALSDITLLDKSFDGPGADYVFWDPIHPTTKSHGVIADWYSATVSPMSPQIAIVNAGTTVQMMLDRLDPGKTYVLQSSNDLSNWSEVKSFSSRTSRLVTSFTNQLPRSFFRIQCRP